MEDPKTEIVDVVRGLVGRPSFKQQAEVVRHFYAPDARLHHYLVDVYTGVEDIIAVYQWFHACFNYEAVAVQKVLYDRTTDHMAVKVLVFSRPWISLGREVSMEILIHIHLEDWPQPNGKVLKRIKLQRDFFERDPIIQILPIIGPIYSSEKIRFMLGRLEAATFESLRYFVTFFLPSHIKHGLLGLWTHSHVN
ncbi:hypothetical protein GOP47_0007283 [Adiantum capillus-veneris]|uniref:SigF-like NTF2-like domain-containing protein n=1 Tax=Adiantum capillus-veneris TaxID=13818 RepID=A0A9D4V0L4_ADICA|nr:hypothetical protein GOP47_0007283 [Adiantum capillus-veneris]